VEVRQLMNQVKVTGSTDLDRHYPKYWSGRVTVKLAGGSSLSHDVIIPKGESGNPMSRDEVEEKFLSLAQPILGAEKARSVVREVSSLESRDSLEPLLAALRI
jgi:2-methylcitrate dehydratase PrpD